jgi:hypothetical protein
VDPSLHDGSEDTMTILKDPIRPFAPSTQLDVIELESTRPEPPSRRGDDVRAAMRPRGTRGKTSFELASRGGYVRTVTGTIAYLDEQAETYMVLSDGELLRVPVRDITSRHEERPIAEIGRPSERDARDAEGLGTG